MGWTRAARVLEIERRVLVSPALVNRYVAATRLARIAQERRRG
jgi:hypothetical protein